VAKGFQFRVSGCRIVEEERSEFIRRLWTSKPEKRWKQKFDGTRSAYLRMRIVPVRDQPDREESPDGLILPQPTTLAKKSEHSGAENKM
jgi:hypothetical protein